MMAYDSDAKRATLFGGYAYDIGYRNDTWEWRCPCDDDGATVFDDDGEVIFPPDLDPTQTITDANVSEETGVVSDIYHEQDTTDDRTPLTLLRPVIRLRTLPSRRFSTGRRAGTSPSTACCSKHASSGMVQLNSQFAK